jgi:hypothetical protein
MRIEVKKSEIYDRRRQVFVEREDQIQTEIELYDVDLHERLFRWRIQFNPSIATRSLNDLIRPRQHVRRNRKADLLRCFQIDDELELLRLFHGKIRRLSSFENFVNVGS